MGKWAKIIVWLEGDFDKEAEWCTWLLERMGKVHVQRVEECSEQEATEI